MNPDERLANEAGDVMFVMTKNDEARKYRAKRIKDNNEDDYATPQNYGEYINSPPGRKIFKIGTKKGKMLKTKLIIIIVILNLKCYCQENFQWNLTDSTYYNIENNKWENHLFLDKNFNLRSSKIKYEKTEFSVKFYVFIDNEYFLLSSLEIRNHKLHGKAIKYKPFTSEVNCIRNFKDGKSHGYQLCIFEGFSTIYYRENGKLNGPYLIIRENGDLWEEGKYKNNLKHGVFKDYEDFYVYYKYYYRNKVFLRWKRKKL